MSAPVPVPGCRWAPPPAECCLADADVHVWCAALDQPTALLGRLVDLLCDEERTRADRFRLARDRDRFTVGRGILRTILGGYLKQEPAQVCFTYGAHGKPALAESEQLRFNLSHSQGLALLAVARGREVGVDIEGMRPMVNAEAMVERFFSAREAAVIAALPAAQRLAAFFRCWTRKEAYLKGCGDGLARPLDRFSVALQSQNPIGLLEVVDQPDDCKRWSLYHLEPAPDYLAALAVEGCDWRATCYQW